MYNRLAPTVTLVCGLTDDSRRMWRAFVGLRGESVAPPPPWRHLLGVSLFGLACGGAAGLAVGTAVQMLTGVAGWNIAFTMLGFLDGALFGLI